VASFARSKAKSVSASGGLIFDLSIGTELIWS